MLRYKLPLAGLLLACSGCIAAAPPPPPPPPMAVAAPPAAPEPHCREFQQTVMVGGVAQQGYGTTCLQPDGSWQIASPATAGGPPPSSLPPSSPPVVAAAPYPTYPAYPYPYPYSPYPYYAYPGYVGPSVGLGFRFRVH